MGWRWVSLGDSMAAPQTKDLAKQWRQQRFNPLRGLTPASAGLALDEFDMGYFRRVGLMWKEIEERDDVAVTVCGKRRSKVAGCDWDVLIGEEVPEGQRAAAEKQQAILKRFYSGLETRSAVDLNVEGGIKLLIERLMDAALVQYSAFELEWKGGMGGLSVVAHHVPLYFLENTTGALRFAGINGTYPGVPIERKDWLIGVGKAVMKAVTVAYMFKRLSLADWLNLSEKFGIPGVHYETMAQRGTAEWDSALAALQSFGNDMMMLTSQGEKLNLITANMSGEGPFAPMVERMDRAMARIVMGADLSTLSRADGAGASLQGDETEDLINGDCEWVSETLQRQLDRRVLEWHFGRGVEALAYFKLSAPADMDTLLEMKVDDHVTKRGVKLSVADVAERYGRTHDEEAEEEVPEKVVKEDPVVKLPKAEDGDNQPDVKEDDDEA
jgi:phage gp29-like protein